MRKVCENCEAEGDYPDQRQGEEVWCRECGASFLLPIVLQPAPEADTSADGTASMATDDALAPPPRPKRGMLVALVALPVVVVLLMLVVRTRRRGHEHDDLATAPETAERADRAAPRQQQTPNAAPGELQRSDASGEGATDRPETEVRRGRWSVNSGAELLQSDPKVSGARVLFGDVTWSDYEFSLEAKKTAGSEGFLVIFRASDPLHFYWANIGGWGNREHGLEKAYQSSQSPVSSKTRGSIKTGDWYKIQVRANGARCMVWLNGEKIVDHTDRRFPNEKGRVGVGTWDTAAVFRNVEIRSLDGNLLWRGLPEIQAK